MVTAFKLALRSIRTSKARYLSLFFIVLLSVGFYAGLKLCRPQFWQACRNYLTDQHFYDFRIFSDLGFDKDDVKAFEDLTGVSLAEGEKSLDAMADIGGTTSPVTVMALPQSVNVPSVVSGRLPESDDECVVDHRALPDSAIGETITVDSEDLKETTLTVVGTVNSLLYLNADRGSTSLGNGSLSGFVYVTKDNFTTDYDTAIDLVFSDSASYDVFSDAYDDYIADNKSAVKEKAQELADASYEDILDEILEKGQKKIDEANADLQANAGKARMEQDKAVSDAVVKVKEQLDPMVQAGMMTEDAEQKQLVEVRKKAEKAADEAFTPIPLTDLTDDADTLSAFKDEIGKDQVESVSDLEKLSVPDMTRGDVVQAAEDEGVSAPTVHVLTRSENAGYVSFESDTSIINAIADVFPIFFILIAILVCVTTMTRMVEEERSLIGTLKALGYSDGVITMKYLTYALLAALPGWAVGYLGGTIALPQCFWLAYSVLYDFTDLPYVFSPSMAGLTLAVTALAMIVSVYASCRSELISSPAVLIRPKSAKPGRRIFLERITPLWKRLSFLRKASLRNMLRSPLRAIMMVIGIGCCAALVTTAFGVRDSMIDVGNIQYDTIQTYDLTVGVDEGSAEDAGKKLDGYDFVTGTLPASEKTVDVKSDASLMSSCTLLAFNDGADLSGYWAFTGWNGESVSYPAEKGDVLISRRLAQKLGVSVGDTLRVEDGEVSLTVSGIFRNYIGNFLFVTEDTYAEDFAEDREKDSDGNLLSNTLLVKTTGDLSDDQLTKVNETEGVASVSALADSRAQVNHSLSCLNYIIWLIIGFSGALAFVVIFNLTNINIAERSREIATVEVLGFTPKETRSYVLWENLALSVVAGVIGQPFGYLFCRFIIGRILIDQMTFPVLVMPVSYCFSIVITILFAVIVNRFMRSRIARIHMAESLKAVE